MEISYIPQTGKTISFDSLADEALKSRDTDALFVQYERLFVEVCARWIQSGIESAAKIAAFGRILPLAPHIAEHVERFLTSVSTSPILGSLPAAASQNLSLNLPDSELLELLLGTFRLLSYQCRDFARHVQPLALEKLFSHSNSCVRYLAVRIYCLYVHAADHATETLLKSYVGVAEMEEIWEGGKIDYRFLSLWEEKRWSHIRFKLQEFRTRNMQPSPASVHQQLSPYTVNIADILLPRLGGAPSHEQPSEIVSTPTTELNLSRIASTLLDSSPILLTGLAGSGKTLLMRHFAWQLNKLDSMVTLHLNEQSDAKLLIGMYATGAKPGTFSWRPGVLTTAVKEGRWIFIEDLDRAPNEIVSTLLPLIESGELLIPSRGETIRAARGFRIIATMRSTLNPAGQQIIPRQNMIGLRFWNSVSVQMPELSELEQIIFVKYPSLQKHIGGIMRTYARLLGLFSDAKFSSENGTSLRALTPRDLLKWCDRISVLLEQAFSFSTAQMDDIFMEAFDCFAGSLRSEQSRAQTMACVAEELHIDPQRRDHLLQNREIKLEVPTKGISSGTIRIGRAKLSKHRISKRHISGRPFSTNNYTLRLLEKLAVAVNRQEPLLLVGETGTGKTTCIQYLAEQLGRKMVAFNLSQQSESGDLLGGYKPVNVRSLVIPLKDEFDDLFDTTFSRRKNQRFIEMLGKRVAKGEWKRVCMLWREALKMVDAAQKTHGSQTSSPDPEGGQPKKKRKVDSLPKTFPKARWEKFATDLHNLEAQLANGSEAFAFSFLEGNIVKAVRNGDWVLLDEINLASSDTLEALADLLGSGPDGTPSILLTETGSVERVVAHPDFRVFAAMNPATDVGKKDLPPGIRSRFTELYVESPDGDSKSLQNIVEKYLGGSQHDPAIVKVASDVTKLYLKIQELAKANMLVDGADQKAHFSLRTLTRTLTYAREIAPSCSLRRALFEGFHMSFLTFLGKASEDLVAPLIKEILFPQKAILKAELGKPLQQPTDGRSYVRQGHYWLRQGASTVEEQPHYIITPFVQRNMNNLIRASSTRRYPVLIQGPTSSGKTSMIEYLAKRSGNTFVRINNHEHTDLQEYLGSYISGSDGKLIFQEGILVRALREGHWIVLDELNLAPTDVLEALNRLLDDNRELLIPETQEVVRPHEDFMLFATQNPAGLYGGRKVLSRAFRNRFLELHFDDIPVEELTEILHRRTMIPESWCKRIVNVYQELSTLRQENRLFEQKSFATLRDLFRWAQRKADTIQDLANNGYMLLAERVRKEDERVAVKKIIEDVMSKKGPRVSIDEETMYSDVLSPEIKLCKEKTGTDSSVVWTRAMRRLFVLVSHAIRNNEPVLLVGETGCGKTTVCQMLSDAFEKKLYILNAHQNTETGDLIGAQRPIRNRAAIEELLYRQVASVFKHLPQPQDVDVSNLELPALLDLYDKLDQAVHSSIPLEHREEIYANRVKAGALFEWADGSLVHAMKTGQYFLLDEISLADDSVLERLNSVLESSRTLLLAEKGPVDSLVTATEGFQFLATMNPGGDYGKKELSPALRNRFTEIWVPALSDVDDILQIVRSRLKPSAVQHASSIVAFSQWFNEEYNTSVASSISIRDTLAWVIFINRSSNNDPVFAIVHGAAMVFIDTLGANPAGLLAISPASIDEERKACLHRLSELLGTDVSHLYFGAIDVLSASQNLKLGAFSIPKFAETSQADVSFSLEAPTTRSNAMRVVRALQLSKPILLEGNPGVGKTTLITALAKAIGKPLTRLNLSEQTDLMDLFGSDVPVEGGQAGTFAWRDAPFLKAMKNGDWVLLDEMNLASQSVLEGLNAVLDHRGEVYISELDQTFHKHSDFRVFAAQNPHHQGGGRKGLPASFVNRFTVVYADIFRPEDLMLICSQVFPDIQDDEVKRLIGFVAELDDQVVNRRAFGHLGAPWEFNLRDTLRWLQLLSSETLSGSARDFLDTIFAQRFRSEADRARLLNLFQHIYGVHQPRMTLHHDMSSKTVQVGLGTLSRNTYITNANMVPGLRVSQLAPLEALMVSVRQNWPVILVGPPGSGKTSILSQIASVVGANLITFSMNPDIDSMDLVGGYEQADPTRQLHRFLDDLEHFIRRKLASSIKQSTVVLEILQFLNNRPMLSISNLAQLLEQASTADQDFVSIFQDFQDHIDTPQHIDGAKFQWVDGILIQALEQGKWLVLDNANLCSSAVLDRLNSLLEPNGYLSINEHSTADGEARIVKPHADFRIFMTMDPRFGELSRAMRNRAVEIYLLPREDLPSEAQHVGPVYPLESSMYRFRHLCGSELIDENDYIDHLDNLSLQDSKLLPSFKFQAALGLCPATSSTPTNGAMQKWSPVLETPRNLELLRQHSDFLVQTWIKPVALLKSQLSIENHDMSLQTYHPLNNELYLHRSKYHQTLSAWYASLYDLSLDLFTMHMSIQQLPSSQLERRKEKQKLRSFLYSFWKSMNEIVAKVMVKVAIKPAMLGSISAAKGLRQLFWAFHELAANSGFDRATFQTYLKMLKEVTSALTKDSSPELTSLANELSGEVAVFGSDVHLTTGLGMERIWRYYKPITPKTSYQLSGILGLESLADRLDAVMWASNLKLDEMVQIRERFTSSLDLVRTQDVDASELIKSLESAVHELEQGKGEENVAITPYFEDVFEGLCQFLDLTEEFPSSDRRYMPQSPEVALIRAKGSLLARRPTKATAVNDDSHPSSLFMRLQRHLGPNKASSREMILKDRFHIAMLSKLHGADEVQLLQLDQFENELTVLAQQLVLDSTWITRDQQNSLRRSFLDLANGLYASHSADIITHVNHQSVKFRPEANISPSYAQTLHRIKKCYNRALNTRQIHAQDWATLGLAGLVLYVPNYPHDPALRPMIERKLFNKEKEDLVVRLRSLRHFQKVFTGQESSFRIREIERLIQEMGDEPPVPAIIRPETSELDSLQGEFTNLLSVIHPFACRFVSIQDASKDETLQKNIAHIIRRLEEGYRSYDDITAPAVGFLVCLNIGLALGSMGVRPETDISRSLKYMTHHTPFFGLHTWYSTPSSAVLMRFCEEQFGQKHAVDLRWHALHSLVVIKTIDPKYLTQERTRLILHKIFLSFYSDWKIKLLQDQQEEAKNSSLYTYRGEDDDAEEEDPSLFPDYEVEEEENQPLNSSTSREHAVRLANMHAEIFVGSTSSSNAIKEMLEWCAFQMNRVAGGEAHNSHYENSLPAIYLALGKKSDALASSGTGKGYNFYFDANLPEAKRLITLIHRIQARYRQIRSVWPEHATLWDVLRTCDEALEFRHVDPVAKFITKAEKLYSYMYEWQRVASREFSTTPLFDDLTKLLVSWRQLELTTWARLFEIEIEKCRDNAKSWFFVAYETIIAAADVIENAVDMKTHAKDLLMTMEGFFLSTTLGQYQQRITLLRQLEEHVSMRLADNEILEPIQVALKNFLRYFSRLEKPVHDALVQGRQKLDKDVNNVIKLASWKDTNIEALKQSAKTSHRKLSKLVRKFRSVLNQPVSSVAKAGFSEEGIIFFEPRMGDVSSIINPEALELCAASIPAWADRPTRFKNLAVTITMMRKLSSPSNEALDGAAYLESFMLDLETSIIKLQKATPNLLTDENKPEVQHLKTQKRKLYADTMKELRQMGIKSNLSSDVLARQDELSTVLASLPIVSAVAELSDVGKGAELFMHKSLSIMSEVRDLAKEHSGDLTSNDVARSIGYIEGLLNATIKQRGMLSNATLSFNELKLSATSIAALCAIPRQEVQCATDTQVEAIASLRPSLSWLRAILDTGAEIIAVQAKLGKTNELAGLIQDMREWSGRMQTMLNDFDSLPSLPENVWSEAQEKLSQSVKTLLIEFRKTFDAWTDQNPVSLTVLHHIQPFLFDYPAAQYTDLSHEARLTVEAHSKEIFIALDMILGSLQDVETALKDLPTSTDDATWLAREDQALSRAISCLHTSQVANAINTILGKIHCLHENENLRAITALFVAIQPVFNQYGASHKFLIERLDALHCSTAKLLHRLSKSFIQVGTKGFCQPSDKSADQEQSKDDKLEAGTGLGEGEGAEDISKDIEDDEDLEELAQQKGEREGSIEEEDDAVDMGEQDMEGETGEMAEKEDKGSEDGEEGDDDVQSEVGSVDDLGPSAVDEKMWDEGGKEDDLKEREGKEDVGTENQEEQVASEQKDRDEDKGEKEDKETQSEQDEEMEIEGEDQEENVGVGETEQMDPHAKEEETLDLPEDLNMDGEEGDKDDNLGDMDMDEDLAENEQEEEAGAEPDTVEENIGPEKDVEDEKDTTGHIEDEEDQNMDSEGEEDEGLVEDDAIPLPDQNNPEDETGETKDDAADPNAESGAGADANEEAHKNQNEQASASAANREDGNEGESTKKQQETTAEDGTLGQTTRPDAGGHGEQPEDSPQTQSFKKLGDVLEKWYNQQKEISEAREKDETQIQQLDKDIDMAKADFEHLADEETQADTQALGTATEEQATALDHDMAMAIDDEETAPMRPEDKDEQVESGQQQDVEMEDAAPPQNQEPPPQSATEGQPQTFIGEQNRNSHNEDDAMDDAVPEPDSTSETSSIAEVDTQLELTHLDIVSDAPTPEQARSIWQSHEASTHSLSLQLTESLRLILAPTLATKLRGDFRTGKRLNLKRIIPYIASGYKRDKIWLRRSMPSKRSYQVLIALDDSRSMRDGGAVEMGLKTLTLVTRSLTMLEVGEVSVVGFGEGVNVAHAFDKPFTSEAGVNVFSQFGFAARKTDVRGLVERSLQLFSEARAKGNSGAEELWQLMLVVSDGICDSHAEIQRLVRKAQEERVMIVFVIIDSSASSTSSTSAQQQGLAQDEAASKEKEKTSIMDLTSVDISPEGKIVKWKYMERFPFRYYLVVRDVRELPSVLAAALRQWFGEVAGSV